MHREKGLPFTVLVARHAAGICAEPFITVGIDADAEHVLVCQSVVAGKGIQQRMAIQIDFIDAERGTDPEAVATRFDRQRAHISGRADVEHFDNLRPRPGGSGLCLTCILPVSLRRRDLIAVVVVAAGYGQG